MACGLTLIGATTYFVTTRLVKKRRRHQKKRVHLSDESEGEDMEDYLHCRPQQEGLRKRNNYLNRAPALITYDELYEHALMLDQQRKM